MNDSATTQCTVPECIASPEITDPIPLCFAHVLHVVSLAMPHVVRAAAISSPDGPSALRMLPLSTEKLLAASGHDPIVYFIRNGDRVKIGTSRNLRGRVATLSLRPENVMLAISGGTDVERQLHERFHDLRVGNTEWFRYTQVIVDFISQRSASSTAVSLPAASSARSSKGPDVRRDLVFSLVEEAGEDGIGPEDLVRMISERFPAVEPPHPATIGRWLSADPRITKPAYGRYAASV